MSADRPPLAWRVVLPAALAQAVALTVGSQGYGYHRDELYYRMLPPAWGYVDQPPLTPLLARLTTHLADQPWAIRLPATLAAVSSVVVLALICRELGGGRAAQALTAWGYAFAALPLMLGHVLLTSTLDLALLLLVTLAILRATRGPTDRAPRAWLAAGALAGVTAYNRWIVAAVVLSLVAGIALCGPRRQLATRWPWLGALVAAVVAAPNLVYQATHDWPQLAMGDALSAHNAGEVRGQVLPLLVIMLGPPLAVVWVTGLVWLVRRPQRAAGGFLAVGCVGMVAFTIASGAQPHYPVHLLSVAYAAGCVPVARWLAARRVWWGVGVALVAVNSVVSVVLALPVVPAARLGATPLADISPLVADQVGWPRYVAQVAEAYRHAPEPRPTVVIASNYGEAGALARYGPALRLPPVVSGHNALGEVGPRPAGDTTVVVFVGYQFDDARAFFARCDVVARLDNGLDVDNEEQGAPVAVCRGPREPWAQLWPRAAHLD